VPQIHPNSPQIHPQPVTASKLKKYLGKVLLILKDFNIFSGLQSHAGDKKLNV
jgi:hypothetical protein